MGKTLRDESERSPPVKREGLVCHCFRTLTTVVTLDDGSKSVATEQSEAKGRSPAQSCVQHRPPSRSRAVPFAAVGGRESFPSAVARERYQQLANRA